MRSVYDPELEPRKLAVDVVEGIYPKKNYDDIMVYEAWPMRRIMENLIEIALQKIDGQTKYVCDINNDLREQVKALKQMMLNPENHIILSNEDFDRFMEELNNPPPPNEALKAAAKRYKDLVDSGQIVPMKTMDEPTYTELRDQSNQLSVENEALEEEVKRLKSELHEAKLTISTLNAMRGKV